MFYLCLSVCLSTRLLKKLQRDFDEIFGGVVRGPRTNQLDFGGGSVCDLDLGIFYRIRYLSLQFLQRAKNKT